MQMILNLIGVKIRLVSNTEELFGFIRGFDHILDIYYQELIDDNTYDCTLTFYNDNISESKVLIDKDDVVFIAKWEKVYRSTAIRTLLILIAERYRQQHLAQITLHASAVSYNDLGFIFMGGQGAGKTTLAMNLTINGGCNYISNEHTVIGSSKNGISIIGASGPLSLRFESLAISFPETANKLFPQKPNDVWNNKKRVSPNSLGMNIETRPVKLKNIFIVSLNKSGNNYIKQIQDPYKMNAFLYEESSRIIKGVALPLYTPDGDIETYCPSFDSEIANRQRLTVIKKIQGSLFMLSGTLEFCSQHIEYLLNNEG